MNNNSVFTNQFSSIPGVSVSYDANGNLLTDNLNAYTWNPNWGNMLSVNTGSSTVNATYDALGRVVEQYNGSAYTQVLYSAIGKTALMSGSTLAKAFIPLPGAGTAIYTSSSASPAYYRHADSLGSSRLTSTAARGISSSMAYAPFGEQYSPTGTADPSFTGQNSDTVASLYDFTFREHSMSQGRWISPDPADVGAVDPTNPQTWNRYAYVVNNPLSYIDALGLSLIVECVPYAFWWYWDDGWHPIYSADCNLVDTGGGGGTTAGGGGGGGSPANNGKSICSGAAGKTIPVNAPFGQMRFQFDGSGNLIGLGLQLTGMNGVSGNGLSIPPNTFAGFTQLSPGTVQFGFSNPVNVGSGFSQAYVQTATFSGGRYTSVQGAYAPLGIPLGSSSGNSSLLQWFLNGNSSTASQAQNFGNLMTSFASL